MGLPAAVMATALGWLKDSTAWLVTTTRGVNVP
jgi:hypothetical protein